MKAKFTVGAFGIITDEKDRILLCHRNDMDLWNMPGGGVEKGESPWEAVAREVKEETGLVVKVNKLLGVYGKSNKNDLVFTFKCDVLSGNIVSTSEADRSEYFSNKDIPENIVPKQLDRINDYFSDKSKPIMKVQNIMSSREFLKKYESKK